MGMVVGDARSLPVAAGSVQCVVTSPPYWGLRDYGTATFDGGEPGCDHLGPPVRTQAGFNARYFGKEFATDKQGDEREPMGQVCAKCGARRIDKQLGLESTPNAYVANMVQVFREVWRVLRDDGTLWLNLGDSYAGGGRGSGVDGPHSPKQRTNLGSYFDGNTDFEHGLKPKDLVGIPWRVAFALQADGWYLRQDVIWAKPNPMPESVRDRCTKAHEYIFLLTKRQRYYYDAEAIAEPSADKQGRVSDDRKATWKPLLADGAPTGRWSDDGGKYYACPEGGRNRRSVWTVNTQPYAEAHFATFPEKLVEPCVLAGTKPGDLVLDPFAGSGTVGAVCRRLARRFVGVELNPKYVDLARARMARVQPGLALEVA